MNWKNYCNGFAIQKNCLDWESKCLIIYSVLNKVSYKIIKNNIIEDGWIPNGSVEWILSLLDESIVPDYFPIFLKNEWVKRKTWAESKWPLNKIFIKPADRYKRFNGFITSGTYSGKKKGPFICSNIVTFIDEWRYYIAYGKLIGAYWYIGKDDIPKPAPELNINFPSTWCGTADFGLLSDGTIELIECHHPFACGWYGKNHEEYAEFLTCGWNYIKNKEYKKFTICY